MAAERAGAQSAAKPAGEVIVERDVKIGMRTGTVLKARVYRPAGSAPVPTILSIESDTTAERDKASRALAAAGYAVVIAAPRGGDDKHVGRDGYDACEWISDKSWSDRHIVMAGIGEGANAAWNTAREHPPWLTAIISRTPARPLGWNATDLSRVTVPALTIAGAAGEPQGAAIDTYLTYTRAPTSMPGVTRISYLLVGSLVETAFLDVEQGWFDFLLGRGPQPPLLKKHITYMTMHDGLWTWADTYDAIGAFPTSYPLHSDAGPRSAPGGFLGGASQVGEPADTLTAAGKSYSTLLSGAIDLAGQPTVALWFVHANPSAVEVAVEEVLPDASAKPLGVSAGHMKMLDSTLAAGKNDPVRYEFSSFAWIAKRIAAGSSIRLTVKAPGAILLHDADRYSRLILPVVRQSR